MSVIMVTVITRRMELFKVKFRFILSALLVALDFVVIGLGWFNAYLINFLLVVVICFVYKQDVGLLIA